MPSTKPADSTSIFILTQIRNQYHSLTPLRAFTFHHITPSPAIQTSILSHTIHSSYGAPKTYQAAFLKHLISYTESHEIEVEGNVYTAVAHSMASPSYGTADMAVKTYFPPSLQPISLHESLSFASGGTTGLCSWTASLVLADYLLTHHEHVLRHCTTVVELGAGTGLLSIVMSNLLGKHRALSPSRVYATDHHPQVLQNLSRNTARNGSNVLVEELDWITIQDDPSKAIASLKESVNLIIASDVIFCPSLIPHLLNTILFLLRQSECEYGFVRIVRPRQKPKESTKKKKLEHWASFGCLEINSTPADDMMDKELYVD
ncbi:hypothetical protein SeLEV6574_g07143 [Synchytrium endobioticum]|uniref:FAM86 N-terminal domain-containing protein n=1 Tax=Synchytrium endobioticum TaxID=286115 RepID=A0A507CM67_9FUNG|nr:hypothetical protein SeLEV6574_g07143 [Synchytrium endobioticum]